MNCDLALCVGINKTTENTNENKYYSYAKYIWEVEDPPDCEPVYDKICSTEGGNPNWKDLLAADGENLLGGVRDRKTVPNSGSGAYLYYYRWLLLQKLRENDLIKKYKWFIITRSDFVWNIPHPNTSLLNENHIYIPDGEKYGGVTDRHTILPAKHVETYLKIIHGIVHIPEVLKSAYPKFSKVDSAGINPESFIKWWLEYNNIYKYVKFFPYIMFSVREENGSTSWSKGLWSEDIGCYIKYYNELISYKKFVNVFKTQEDWANFFPSPQCTE